MVLDALLSSRGCVLSAAQAMFTWGLPTGGAGRWTSTDHIMHDSMRLALWAQQQPVFALVVSNCLTLVTPEGCISGQVTRLSKTCQQDMPASMSPTPCAS